MISTLPPTDTIEKAEARLFDLAETGEVRGNFVTLRSSVLAAIEHAEKAYKSDGNVTGVTTGLIDIDKILGGLQNSDLLILAGRPSMGKTALATNIAFAAANKFAETGGAEGAIVGFFQSRDVVRPARGAYSRRPIEHRQRRHPQGHDQAG
jgi:replicative DNA helicase